MWVWIAVAVITIFFLIGIVVAISGGNNNAGVANNTSANVANNTDTGIASNINFGAVPVNNANSASNWVANNNASVNVNAGGAGNIVVQAPEGQHFWMYGPGSGYINGKTYSEAKQYCMDNGGKIATRADLIRAGQEKNWQACAAGWLEGPDAGYYMQGTYTGCGSAGFNGWPSSNPDTRKLGVYCVGAKAPTANIGAKTVFW